MTGNPSKPMRYEKRLIHPLIMYKMQTLKRFQLLDARKVQKERIGKKAQQLILGGYGKYDGFEMFCWAYE